LTPSIYSSGAKADTTTTTPPGREAGNPFLKIQGGGRKGKGKKAGLANLLGSDFGTMFPLVV